VEGINNAAGSFLVLFEFTLSEVEGAKKRTNEFKNLKVLL